MNYSLYKSLHVINCDERVDSFSVMLRPDLRSRTVGPLRHFAKMA